MASLLDAIALTEKGELSAATAICQEVLRGAEVPEAYGILAEIDRRGADFRAMRDHASKAVELAPRSVEYHHFLGLALLELGALDEAIEALDRALELRLTHEPAHAALNAALARRGRFDERYHVTVITPTIGTPSLARAIASVQSQSYARVDHLVIVDGPDGATAARAALPGAPKHPCHLIQLPFNTGADGFKGHRIYGAAVHLAAGRYVAFLDEDNWFAADHVENLMRLIETGGLEWAYALRAIVDADGREITKDDCESLGKWPLWRDASTHFIDMNCYLLRRDLAIEFSPRFYRRSRDLFSPDAALCLHLLKTRPRFDTNGAYTVNYTAAGGPGSVTGDFFLRGNAVMRRQYPDGFPWRKPGHS